ncbi:MAG: 50S ribosomal protein L4 [Oligoflexia bacterium]|nr:50S ribosomal protein L4 [Oligoflexia bacterium]
MLSVPVVNFENKKISNIEVPKELFNHELRPDLLQTVVRWQLACRRAGTVATKTKGLVRGGGKKPFKQKGTGNARQGSSRSILMPGGGTAFGPQPRDYSYTLQKKVKKAGLRVALSLLFSQNKVWVLDKIDSDGKTKKLSEKLKALGVTSAVIVDDSSNQKLKLAARNLYDFKFVSTQGLNVFDLLKYDGCVLTKNALMQITEKLGEHNVQ